MTRMNSRTRRNLYPVIAKRDGEFCKNCQTPSSEKQLVLDHKNNDNSDNSLENLQLLCKSCNYLKNPRKKPVDNLCVSVCEEDRPMSPEMKENRRMEPRFRRWVFHKVFESGKIRYEDSINAGAEFVGCSTETVKRYLKKMTSVEGSYEIRTDPHGYHYLHFKELVPSKNKNQASFAEENSKIDADSRESTS